MRTVRFLPSKIWSIAQAESGSAVFIRPDEANVVLPVYVSEFDIQNILIEMTHILAPRPMVHELLLSAIDSLEGKLERVEIYGIRAGTYLCRIVIKKNGRLIRLESRPSDILCLSARIECPVHIHDDVVQLNAIPVESLSSFSTSRKSDIREPSECLLLQSELQLSLDTEDYERAVLLRDEIKLLTQKKEL